MLVSPIEGGHPCARGPPDDALISGNFPRGSPLRARAAGRRYARYSGKVRVTPARAGRREGRYRICRREKGHPYARGPPLRPGGLRRLFLGSPLRARTAGAKAAFVGQVYLGHPYARGPPVQSPDVCAFVIGLGRLVGFHPRIQQPLPGTKKVRQGYERLKWAFFSVTAVKDANML